MVWAFPKPDSINARNDQILKPEMRVMPESLQRISWATPQVDVTTQIEAVPQVEVIPAIVGGVAAYRGEFPEFTALYVLWTDGYLYPWGCGGTLISANKVMTAAHCTYGVHPSWFYVHTNHYSDYEYIPANQFIPASYKNEHPHFNTSTLNNDISILTLNRNATTPVGHIYGGNRSLTGYMSTIIGLGYLNNAGSIPTYLQKVNVPVVSNATCSSVYGSDITPSMLCAGYSSGGVGFCNGDSGGPLFVNYQGLRAQAGIISWYTYECGYPYYYDVTARTSALINFIKQYAPAANIVMDPPFNPAILFPILFE